MSTYVSDKEKKLNKQVLELEQTIRQLSNELKEDRKKLKQADAALYKLGEAKTKAERVATIIELTARVQDLLEANNRELERRIKTEQNHMHISKFYVLVGGSLFQANLKLEEKLKEAKDELARSNKRI